MQRWKFGVDQTAEQEKQEIKQAQLAGLEDDYMRAREWSRKIEAETERRRARHRDRERARAQATAEPPSEAEAAEHLPTPEEVEAARTWAGGWSRATLSRWGVPWPPPKGWRRALEAQRTGRAPRPPGWSGPMVMRRLDGFEEEEAA